MTQPKVGSRAPKRALHDTRLLLVESDLVRRTSWERTVRVQGADPVSVRTVNEACRAIEHEGRFDAVVLDFVMPGGDATRIVATLSEVCRDPGVLLVTGMPESSARRLARRIRADRLLLEPAHPEALVAGILAAMGAQRARAGWRPPAIEPPGSREPAALDALLDRILVELLRRAGLTRPRGALAVRNRLHGLADARTARQLDATESTVRGIVARACAQLGADDCRDVPRVLLREIAWVATMLAACRGTTAEALLGSLAEAMAALPGHRAGSGARGGPAKSAFAKPSPRRRSEREGGRPWAPR